MKIFLCSSSVYSCHLFLISSASVRSIPFPILYWAHLCMKCSLGISIFLEEISSLSHFIVFLYFSALIAEEGILISPCYSLELRIQMLISFLFSFFHLVKAMVFPVVMYGCESWTVKKAEHRRIDAFQLWCWRRLLRVPWTARRSNQSILKEISPGISLEGMMLKLKVQYFGHLMRKVDSLEKTLMLGGIGGRRRRGNRGWDGWMASLTRWMWVWVNSGRWWWTGRPGVL